MLIFSLVYFIHQFVKISHLEEYKRKQAVCLHAKTLNLTESRQRVKIPTIINSRI